MAQYKVPQDVEADDKLIGPFSFRQFVYLLIAGGLVALGVALFQIFPALVVIPLPFVAFFLILALPLKKDQPMETYLAALVSYYLKPHTRKWVPGQRETTILITAPKIVEDTRARDISGEEATNRLSFLANLVDTKGYAIKGASNTSVREDTLAETNATTDMYDNYKMMTLGTVANQRRKMSHEEAVQEMREAIERNNATTEVNSGLATSYGLTQTQKVQASFRTSAREAKEVSAPVEEVKKPEIEVKSPEEELKERVMVMPTPEPVEKKEKSKEKPHTIKAKPSIIELASNTDFKVSTIAKEAKRLNRNRKDEGEVFISLH